jgi:hypothetical protein
VNGVVLSQNGIPAIKPPLGSVQIDLMFVKKGYTPKLNELLDPRKIIHVFDIKTCAVVNTATIREQLEELKRVTGAKDVIIPKSRYRYSTKLEKLVLHKRNIQRGWVLRFLSAVGAASAVYATLNSVDAMDEVLTEATTYLTCVGTTLEDSQFWLLYASLTRFCQDVSGGEPLAEMLSQLAVRNAFLNESGNIWKFDPDIDL